MRVFLDKKGLSNVVGYALLVVIGISLSVLVYGWLQGFVDPGEIEECPSGVGISILNFSCVTPFIGTGRDDLNLTIRNRGLFDVDGYVVRVDDRAGSEFGVTVLNESGIALNTSEEITYVYSIDGYNSANPTDRLSGLSVVDVQPFLISEEGDKIFCEVYSSQELDCS